MGLRQTNELKSECKILNYWSKFPGRQIPLIIWNIHQNTIRTLDLFLTEVEKEIIITSKEKKTTDTGRVKKTTNTGRAKRMINIEVETEVVNLLTLKREDLDLRSPTKKAGKRKTDHPAVPVLM